MRFFFFWLIRFGGAAIGFLLGVLVSLDASTGMADVMICDPWAVADLAAAGPEHLRKYPLNLVLMGNIDGVLMAMLTLVGCHLSGRLALCWTGVVLAGEADAVVHPAVVHVEALSSEVRKSWVDVYPSQTCYGIVVLLLLVASGAVVTYVFDHLTGAGEIVAIGFISGIIAYSSIRASPTGLTQTYLEQKAGQA
jgi:hypothetical protein